MLTGFCLLSSLPLFCKARIFLQKSSFLGGRDQQPTAGRRPSPFFTSRIGLLSFFDRVFIVFLSMLIRIIELATARAAEVAIRPWNDRQGISVWAVHHHASHRNPQDLHWYMPSTLSSIYLPTSRPMAPPAAAPKRIPRMPPASVPTPGQSIVPTAAPALAPEVAARYPPVPRPVAVVILQVMFFIAAGAPHFGHFIFLHPFCL